MYRLTCVYECFIGKELSYNENRKFQYILSTPKRKTYYKGKQALSARDTSQYSCPSCSKGNGEPNPLHVYLFHSKPKSNSQSNKYN